MNISNPVSKTLYGLLLTCRSSAYPEDTLPRLMFASVPYKDFSLNRLEPYIGS